jgi:hypothetical protein
MWVVCKSCEFDPQVYCKFEDEKKKSKEPHAKIWKTKNIWVKTNYMFLPVIFISKFDFFGILKNECMWPILPFARRANTHAKNKESIQLTRNKRIHTSNDLYY